MEIPAGNVHALNIESQPNEECRHENPIEKIRKPTNRRFVFIFLLILILWITVCLIGFFSDYYSHDRSIPDKYLAYINEPVIKISYLLPVTLFFCIVFTYICLLVGEKASKACVYTSMMMMVLYVISSSLKPAQFVLEKTTEIEDKTIEILKTINNGISLVIPLSILYALIYILPNFIYTIAGINSFLKVDKRTLCDITNHSCWSILYSFPSLLFIALITIFEIMVYSFILNATIYNWFSDRGSFIGIFAIIIIIGGLSVVNVFDNYARMVISEYTIQSFWAKDQKAAITPIAWKVFRNHIGTVMFASTMILSFFTSMLQALKHKPSWRNKEGCVYFVTKFALVTSPDIALIFTSIYGTSFIKSYQKTFDTVLRRCTTCMAMLMVLDGFLSIIWLVLLVPFCIILFSNAGSVDPDELLTAPGSSTIIHGVFYSLLAFGLLISSTMKAQLINKIIMLNKEDHDAEEAHLNRNK